jgi:hypothetical protein
MNDRCHSTENYRTKRTTRGESKRVPKKRVLLYTVLVESNSIYEQGVQFAKRELASLTVEFEKLAERKQRLEAYIAIAEPLITGKSSKTANGAPSSSLPPGIPIWKAIKLSINGKGSEFSVKDALEALERIGRPVTGKNNFQIVRKVLTDKTDEFDKIGIGKYALKNGRGSNEMTPGSSAG